MVTSVGALASSVVDLGFETRLGRTKNYKIGTYYFSTEHVALRSKCKDWLAMNQDNVPEWNDMSARVLLFQ
jgi:hypothetical protein